MPVVIHEPTAGPRRPREASRLVDRVKMRVLS